MNFHASKRQIFKTSKAFIAALSLSALSALPVAAQSGVDPSGERSALAPRGRARLWAKLKKHSDLR